MPICPKCHRFKPKKIFNRHKKSCIPSQREKELFMKSKGFKCQCDNIGRDKCRIHRGEG